MTYTLYFDFESYDPELLDKGSCYIWSEEFHIIGMSFAIDDGEVGYTTNYHKMMDLIENALILVAHNISYELGCIEWLNTEMKRRTIDYKYKPIFCTMIGSKLENNLRMSNSLDYLAKTLLQSEKDQERFGRLVMEHTQPDGSKFVDYPKKYYTTDDQEYKEKTELKYVKKATKWAMQNLHIVNELWPDVIAEYAISDVKICRQIHKIWTKELDKFLYSTFSDVSKITVAMRKQGVKIDLDAAQVAWDKLDAKVLKLQEEAESKGWWCNYASNKQLSELLLGLGIPLPKKESGNYQCDKRTLEDMDHPIGAHILLWRKFKKARDDFVGMLQRNSIEGRIHGTMNILGAKATGRFSHTNPNLAQIPSRDKEIGPMLRSLFIAEDKEEWFSLDFSAQEPRLYVHWAAKCQRHKPQYKKQRYNRDTSSWEFCKDFTRFNCPMVSILKSKYHENPQLDSHSFNQELIKETTGVEIDRTTTKTFALGKAYGKGVKSTAEQLSISYEKALDFSKAFDKAAPYISMTSDYAQYLFIERGFIKTLLGRKNRFDGVGYRAYNYLIQGSAADQMSWCMIEVFYKLGIIPATVVHDELNFSGTKEQAEQVKQIMENCIKLEIPSFTDIGQGRSWGEAK
jgi:DNA polymerase I-like protein with 3'-5' exonuclease and polymerase domains